MPYLYSRQDASPGGIVGTAAGVKNTFSSWDACMSKTYCKWPVIVAIIVVGLILLSLLWCFARCLCCGAECACCCFRCCAGCCGSKNKRHKHLDSSPNTPYRNAPPSHAWNQQYQSAPAPVYGAAPVQAAPQFATFDASRNKPVHEDSLPMMPSWENAASRKVEVIEHPESHELDKINPNNNYDTSKLQLAAARQGGPHSPVSEQSSYLGGNSSAYTQQPYGQIQPHADSHSGYRGAAPSSTAVGYAGGQQYGGSQRHDQYDAYGNGPVSPLYSQNTGSTAYDPPQRHYGGNQPQGQSPYGQYNTSHNQSPYGGGQYDGSHPQDRKPVNGSWRDI
ncbi:hypothetical protein EJ08DRAFT_730453 [Tothia fuscella]|uniref:Uncharacterized protein n=1 Tax=Tothia fuscella TaxID=1048955 RepID=A0A9P4NZS6_9PEZI|nr:hypothetical protein EJ08DRAFT_730453 [Tothia fuscella]